MTINCVCRSQHKIKRACNVEGNRIVSHSSKLPCATFGVYHTTLLRRAEDTALGGPVEPTRLPRHLCERLDIRMIPDISAAGDERSGREAGRTGRLWTDGSRRVRDR